MFMCSYLLLLGTDEWHNSLLSYVFRVPVAVLRSKFSEVAKCFLDLMAKYSDGEATSLLKSVGLFFSNLGKCFLRFLCISEFQG